MVKVKLYISTEHVNNDLIEKIHNQKIELPFKPELGYLVCSQTTSWYDGFQNLYGLTEEEVDILPEDMVVKKIQMEVDYLDITLEEI